MAMTCPLRSTGITPLRHYYEAVRPSPAHRYFRPRGWSRLRLVWGFDCQAVSERRSLSCFLHRFLCSTCKSRFFAPTRSIAKPARAGAVKVGRNTNLSTSFGPARPYLDSSEHGGTLDAIGITIRGEPAFRARRSIAPHPCIRWVQDPNHDAVIRISGEAPRRVAHSFSRHKSHSTSRDSATSNRHQRPVIGPDKLS